MYTNVAGVDELGCRVVPIPNGAVGEVLQILPGPGGTPLPGYGPGGGGGGPMTFGGSLANGVLTLTVQGTTLTFNLRSSLAVDLAGTPLGYWLPLT